MKTGITAAVETGSCSPDYRRWEERITCGHYHRTVEAAQKCLDKKQQSYCNHGRRAGAPCRHCLGYAQSQATSALWYNATLHYRDGSRVE